MLPWDSLFLAGFVYSGYRTVGRWVKYTDDTAKAQSDASYVEGFREFLAEAAAAGDRSKASPGAGAEASGQGHLWRDWNGMKTKQRIALLQEMQKVLEWTGQDAAFRQLLKHKGKPWSQLPHGAKKALMAAADQLDWSFLGDMAADGAALARAACLWQLNEAVPALSAEPALADALLEEEAGLQELVNSADLAVNALLTGQQEVVISALEPAQELQVVEAKRKVDLLREAAQGGLGLGSGGKAARGQQLLELLRGITLTPADEATNDAKAAAAAALDTAADEAVSSLKEQHATALATTLAAARLQALGGALAQQIRFTPGRPGGVTPAVAAGVIGLAADEVSAALSAFSSGGSESGAGAGLAARRSAAEQLMGMASVIDSTAAALAAAVGDDASAEFSDEDGGSVLEQLSESTDKLQGAAIKYCEFKLKSEKQSEGDEAEAAEDREAAAVAAVEEALSSVKAAVAKLPQEQQQASEGEEGAAAAVTADSVREQVMKEVEEKVSAVEDRTKQQQENALQNARTRERMTLLLAQAKKLTAPPAPPAATAAAADDETTAAPEPPMAATEKLAVTEEYLKQLGSRPLAAALTDLRKLLESQAGPEGSQAAGLAAGLTLEAASLSSLTRLGELLSEIDLADAVMSLELGPNVTHTLDLLTAYMDRVKTRQEKRDSGEGGEAAEEEVEEAGSTPKSEVQKCSGLVDELKKDGLVVLGLTTAQYRQLGVLREAAGALSVDLDALKYDRCVTALKDVSAQLGPIGAAIQLKLADTTDEETGGLMAQQKSLAVDLYTKLQAFLSFEDDIRGPLKKCLREFNSLAGGIGAPRTPSACAAATLKLEMAAEEAQKLQELLSALATSAGEAAAGEGAAAAAPAPDTVAAAQRVVETLQGSVEALQASLASLTTHVALRARALNPEVAAAAAAAGLEGADLDLNTLEGMEPEMDHPLHILATTPEEKQAEWESLGFEQVARGRVAAVLLATATTEAAHMHPADTGKSTAGASDAAVMPRCAVAVAGLPSGKCVLQLLAERILRLQQLAAAATFGANAPVSRQIQWYIMTTPATHDKLTSQLKEHHYYGLNPAQVHLFCCKTAPPAFTGEPLKAITMGSATLTRGVPGSGEVFAALKRSGALAHMKRSGVRHVEINAADDNILARPADPLFIGFAADQGLDAAAKVVEPAAVAAAYAAAMPGGGSSGAAAAEGEEAAGQAQMLDEEISFLAPGIGSYYFSYGALNRTAGFYDANPLAMYRLVPVGRLPSKAGPPAMSFNLPPNATQAQRMQAQQALLAAQQAAAAAPPKPVDGYVPTRNISDVFATTAAPGTPSGQPGLSGPLSGCSLAYLGVEREEEFSCVVGGGPHLVVPEPEIAAGDLLALTTSWAENNGAEVECEEGVEVSPLVSYAGEGLEAIAGEGVVFTEPYDLALQGATGQGRAKHNAGPWAVPVLLAYAVGAGLAVAKQMAGGK